MRRLEFLLVGGLTFLLLLLSLGCGDHAPRFDGDAGVGLDARLLDAGPCLTDEDVYREVFGPSCTSSACHDDNRPKAALDLESPGFAQRLIGRLSIHDECADRILVAPGQPAESFLINKLLGTQGACGERMPENNMIDSAQLRCVSDWIGAISDG